jgi:two-component system OmpR family response regulator
MARTESDPASATTHLSVADLLMNEAAREVTRGGKPLGLSPHEFALLRFLMHKAGRMHRAAQILEHVWSDNFGDAFRVTAPYSGHLRQKLRTDREPLIHTVPGPGYVIRPEPPRASP